MVEVARLAAPEDAVLVDTKSNRPDRRVGVVARLRVRAAAGLQGLAVIAILYRRIAVDEFAGRCGGTSAQETQQYSGTSKGS